MHRAAAGPLRPAVLLLMFAPLSVAGAEPPKAETPVGASAGPGRSGGAGGTAVGLVAGPGATVRKGGRPIRAVGVNYFDCFLRTLKRGDDTSYDAGFATLSKKRIPFARFCATGFWPIDMKLYGEDRAEYFRRLDGVVSSARRHGVGLVPSLFWHYACVPDLVGEPMDAWGDPGSKTRAWMREYVREVVARYRDEPAIWAWEFGNEYSLEADLPNAREHRPAVHPSLGTPPTRSARDELSSAAVRSAFAAFATAVREHDPYRLIVTGDSFPRPSAWHQEHERRWTADTPAQFAEVLAKANPDPVDGISLHAYEDADRRLGAAVDVARRLNKPVRRRIRRAGRVARARRRLPAAAEGGPRPRRPARGALGLRLSEPARFQRDGRERPRLAARPHC